MKDNNKVYKNYPKTIVAILEDEETVCILSSKNLVSFLPTYSLEEGEEIPMKKIKSDLKKRGIIIDNSIGDLDTVSHVQIFKIVK